MHVFASLHIFSLQFPVTFFTQSKTVGGVLPQRNKMSTVLYILFNLMKFRMHHEIGQGLRPNRGTWKHDWGTQRTGLFNILWTLQFDIS